MTDDGAQQSENIWPISKFYFRVDFGNGLGNASFQEVSGLDIESQVIEYRDGDSKEFSTIKMPGIVNYGSVTLKKGVLANDNKFFDWYAKINMNTISREQVTITLLD